MFTPKQSDLTRLSTAAVAALLPTLTLAHSGHGLGNGAHWHASDSAGFVLLAVAVAAGICWMRRK